MDQQNRGHLAQPDHQRVFIDELNQIRLVDPAHLESSSKLLTESKQFSGQFEQLQKTIQSVREAAEKIGRITDRERLKLLSLQNQLRGDETGTGSAPPSEERQQLQIYANELQKKLNRVRAELQSLKEVEAQQNEFLLMCKKL